MAGPLLAIPALTCHLMVGPTGFEPATLEPQNLAWRFPRANACLLEMQDLRCLGHR
jgi:hypothetical protein